MTDAKISQAHSELTAPDSPGETRTAVAKRPRADEVLNETPEESTILVEEVIDLDAESNDFTRVRILGYEHLRPQHLS